MAKKDDPKLRNLPERNGGLVMDATIQAIYLPIPDNPSKDAGEREQSAALIVIGDRRVRHRRR